MSALLERPTTTKPPENAVVATPLPVPAPPAAPPPRDVPVTPSYAPLDPSALAGNPVAAAHARRATRPDRDVDTGRIGRILVLGVVVPTVFFLVSNPLGWVLLLFACLAVGALTGIGSIL